MTSVLGKFALVLALGLIGCERKAEIPAGTGQASHAVRSQEPAAQPKEPAYPPPPWRFPAAERVVAVGDVHGDITAARSALRLAGAIDAKDRWIGGSLVVVATGDQLDRGDDERSLMRLLEAIRRQARDQGGTFHVLSGNHEVMNVAGNFDYVSPKGFLDYADVRRPDLGELLAHFPPPAQGRAAAFLPGGPEARLIASWPVIVQVGSTIFVHGGVLDAHVRYGIEKINAEVSAWMSGKLEVLSNELRSQEAPFWARRYSLASPLSEACAELDRVLGAVGAERMVVGHTPQKQGINSACNAKVWRIDVGLSAYYGSEPAEVLEITPSSVRPIRLASATQQPARNAVVPAAR